MTNDGLNTLTYDAENRLLSSSGSLGSGTYTYDGNSLRVQKVSGGSTTVYVYSGAKVIDEYDGAGGVRNEYLYSGRQLLAASNGISNGGFEQGLSGWYACCSYRIVTDATKAHSGNNYMELSTTGAQVVAENQLVAVQPGDQLSFGGWVYLESGSGGYVGWVLAVYDANGNALAYVGAGYASAPSWTYQATSYTVPAGAARVMLYCQIYLPPGAMVARFDDGFLNTGLHYYHADHLSPRITTDSNGNKIGEQAHFPFGESWYLTNSTTKWQFTSYERDAESGNDYALARFNVNRLGRFSSPDPLGGDISDPQSLNRYAYVRNDPIDRLDPLGLTWFCITLQGANGPTTTCEWEPDPEPESALEPSDLSAPPGATPFPRLYFSVADWNDVHPRKEDPSAAASPASAGGASAGGTTPAPQTPTSTTCTGTGRGLSGNTSLVGKQGGIPGQTVRAGTAAVIPQQFGVPNGAALAPYAGGISGTIGQSSFSAVTDVIGGKSPIPGMAVRPALQRLFPGQLILEIPGATDQGANAPVTISVPQGLGCPTGTSPTGG